MPPRPTTAARYPSPLPQEEARRQSQAVRVTDAFYQFLPPKSLTFFKRSYLVAVPRPLIPSATGNSPAFPRILPIAKIQVPVQRVLVFQNVVFTAYRNSNIDPNDYVSLTPFENKRLLGYVGYNFMVGGRSFFDANTGGIAGGTNTGAPSGGQGFPSSALVSNASSALFPYQGSLADGLGGFAAYGMPGAVMEANAVLLRVPPFELERVTVDISGYLLNETQYNRLMENMR